MPNTHNLFISHSWNYGDAYEKLIRFLDDRSYFFYRNHSVPSTNPIKTATGSDRALYRALENKIRGVHVVVILAGVYASHSDWIQAEIDIANKFGKPILAIQPWGSDRTSLVVKKNADKIVGWTTESVVSGIRELSPL